MSPSGTLAGRPSPQRLRALPGPWLFPSLLALHVAEEAPGFTRWAQRYASPRYTGRDFVQINAAGLASTAAAGALVRHTDSRKIFFAWYTAVLTQQALFNPVFHAGTTLAFGTYSPGLVTSLAFPPLWLRYTGDAVRAGRISPRGVRAGVLLGGLIHAAAVARQVFKLGARR